MIASIGFVRMKRASVAWHNIRLIQRVK